MIVTTASLVPADVCATIGGMKRRAPRNVMEHCIANMGMIAGTRVCSFVVCWGIAADDAGHPITLAEYREYWKETERTAQRHLAEFRRCFPQFKDSTPQVLVENARRHRVPAAALGGLDIAVLA